MHHTNEFKMYLFRDGLLMLALYKTTLIDLAFVAYLTGHTISYRIKLIYVPQRGQKKKKRAETWQISYA